MQRTRRRKDRADCSQPNNQKIQLKYGGHWYEVTVVFPEADSISVNDKQLKKYTNEQNVE